MDVVRNHFIELQKAHWAHQLIFGNVLSFPLFFVIFLETGEGGEGAKTDDPGMR